MCRPGDLGMKYHRVCKYLSKSSEERYSVHGLIDRWDRYVCGSLLTVGDSAITDGC